MLLRVSVGYFVTIFSLLTADKGWALTQGVMWLPLFHLIMFIAVIFLDKKGSNPRPEWERYSRLKICDCMQGEAILSQH